MFVRKNDESGFILGFVIITVVVISTIVVGLLSRSVSKTLSGEEVIRQLQAEEIRKGALWQAYANLQANLAVSDYNIVVSNRLYQVDITVGALSGGLRPVTVNVIY